MWLAVVSLLVLLVLGMASACVLLVRQERQAQQVVQTCMEIMIRLEKVLHPSEMEMETYPKAGTAFAQSDRETAQMERDLLRDSNWREASRRYSGRSGRA